MNNTDIDFSIHILRLSLALSPEEARNRFALSQLLVAKDELDEARRHLEVLVASHDPIYSICAKTFLETPLLKGELR